MCKLTRYLEHKWIVSFFFFFWEHKLTSFKILLHSKNHSVSSWNKTDKRQHVHIYFLERGKGCWGNGEVTGACVYQFKRKKKTPKPKTNKHAVPSSQAGLSLWAGHVASLLCGREQTDESLTVSSAFTSLQWVWYSHPPLLWMGVDGEVAARLGEHFLAPLAEAPHRVANLFCKGWGDTAWALWPSCSLVPFVPVPAVVWERGATDNT